MFGYILAGIALIGTVIASYFDLKTTNVPDYPSIYMAAAGIVVNAIASIITNNIFFIQSSLIVGIIFATLGYLKYITKLWGGADFILLAALGFTLPYLPQEFSPMFVSSVWNFPATLFINLLLLGAIYSLAYSVYLSFKKKETLKLVIHNLTKSKKTFLYATIAYVLLVFVSILSFQSRSDLIIPLALRIYVYFALLTLLFVFLNTLQKDVLERRVLVSELKEGDVLLKSVTLRDHKIEASRIEGLTNLEIQLIRKEKKWVLTMEGVPYIPSFVLTVIVSLTLGDLLTAIFTML